MKFQVWQVTEGDWIMARSKEEAVSTFKSFCEYDPEDDEVRPLTEDELDKYQFIDDVDHPEKDKRSFREELQRRILDGEDEPDYFATSEY